MTFVFNDGGRRAAGYSEPADDCAVRAMAIVTGKSYLSLYEKANQIVKQSEKRKIRNCTASTGLYNETIDAMMENMMGWKWVSCKGYATPQFLAALPKGRLLLSMRGHVSTCIDGVVHDTFNPINPRKMIYGYYTR